MTEPPSLFSPPPHPSLKGGPSEPLQATRLRVLTAPRLEPLFAHFAATLKADPLPDPLTPETIAVADNAGLRVWLRHEIARSLGCAAALDIEAPRNLVARMVRALVPDAATFDEERHPFDAGPLAWRLAPFLQSLPADPVYAPLKAFLEQTEHQAMPLARRLGDLFADYQTYRPDVLEAWQRGEHAAAGFAHEPWQAALWRWLVDTSEAMPRSTGVTRLIARLQGPTDRAVLKALPPRLTVFGAGVIAPLFYRALAAAARHVPVTAYAVVTGPPHRDSPPRHPLARALGARTQDLGRVWEGLGVRAEPMGLKTTDHGPRTASEPDGPGPEASPSSPPPDQEGTGVVDPEAPRPPGPPPPALGTPPVEGETLKGLQTPDASEPALKQLQRALVLDAPPAAPVPLRPEDHSIRIHDGHSPTRELEALRDALLDAFADLPGLRPSDVLVLVPDLETYAPLVDAVFGAEDAAPDLRLPVHVVHHPHAPALRVIEAFGRVLRLHGGRVTASALLDLLGTPVVRRAADIGEEELPRLRAWIDTAGVRWGLSGARKSVFGLPEDDLHTWRFGLDRLLLGVMTGPPEGDGLVLGHLPCDAAGLDGADLLGRFCEWAEALFRGLDALDRPAPLEDWPAKLTLFLDGVFRAEDDDEVEAVVFLREQAAELALLKDLTGSPEEPVPFRTVRAHLDGSAGRFVRREPVLTGKITVADPLVLRHAPFRVVAFLGLGDGVWPRPLAEPGYDLIAHAPRPGDAAPRSRAKQLFLDAVGAARDRLLLSHVGRSQKDNAERAASVCLDAFLDATRLHWGEMAEQLVVEHRLQPFATDYYARPGPLASYAAQHRVRPGEAEPPAAFLQGPLPEADADDGETAEHVTLADLAAAWTNPSRFLVRRRLRASLDLDEDALRDDEPVVLDPLERYHLREAVLEGVLDGLSPDALAERLARSGLLPAGAPGASWLRRAHDEAAPIARAVRAWGETEPFAVALDIEGATLQGTLARVAPRGGLHVRAGSVRERHLVAAWVDHLALCAQRPGLTATVGAGDSSCHFAEVPQADARAILGALVRGYRRARTRGLPLYEKASHAYVKKLSQSSLKRYAAAVVEGPGSEPDFAPNPGAMTMAQKAFDDPWNDFTDSDDAYVALAVRGRENPFEPEDHFARWALALWAPLLTHRRDGLPT